jgi:hypothetical protein
MSGETARCSERTWREEIRNAISMEAANRALETAIRKQLRTIASPEIAAD